MLRITNDPIPVVLEVIEELYPGTEAQIQYDPTIKPEEQECGYATYSDELQSFVISISAELPIYAVVEIIAHEAAHIIAGLEEEHGQKWEETFEAIHKAYITRVVAEAEECDSQVYSTDGTLISDEERAAATSRSAVEESTCQTS
jgi:hypothetical protein